MHMEIVEQRTKNSANSEFFVKNSNYLKGKFSTNGFFKDCFLKPSIKIQNELTQDKYEILASNGFIFSNKIKLFKNGVFENILVKKGEFFNICGKQYKVILHNNPNHGIPDIISITDLKKQIALIYRNFNCSRIIYKNNKDLFGKEDASYVFSLDYDFVL